MGFLNRLIIDDLLIKDQQGLEMLRAKRLALKMDLLPLLEGRIRIASAQLLGAQVKLYKADDNTPANYQFVINAFNSDQEAEGSGVDLRVNSLIVRHSSVRFDQYSAKETPDNLNFKHLKISDISAHILLKALQPDSLNLNVKRLAFREQSGLVVDRLSLKAEANERSARLRDFVLHLPATRLQIASAEATYSIDSLPKTLHYHGLLSSSVITLPDLAFLMPQLKGFISPLTLQTDFEGTADDIVLDHLDMQTADNSLLLDADFNANWAGERTVWAEQTRRLHIAKCLFSQLKQALPTLPEALGRLGNIQLTGQAEGLHSGDVVAQFGLLTDVGRMDARLNMAADMSFTGSILTDSLHLGHLLEQEDLGLSAGLLEVKGNKNTIAAQGHLTRLDFKDYPYQNIDIDLTYLTDNLSGKVKIDDPNVETDIEGNLSLGKRKAVRLTGFLRNLSPKALNLTNQWGTATFSAVVDADFAGSTLNDVEGTIDLDDFIMTNTDSVGNDYHLDNIHIKSGYSNDRHFMRLYGDIGEIVLEGQFDWDTLPQSFINYTASILPKLPGLPATLRPANNNFEANIRLTDAEWLQKIFGINLQLEQPLSIKADVNDEGHKIDIDAQLPAFTYDGSAYTNGIVKLTTEADTAWCDARITRLSDNNRTLDLRLQTKAADNQLQSSFIWDNNALSGAPEESMSGILNAITELYSNEQLKPEAHMRLQPSHAIINGTEWTVEPAAILYSDNHLLIDHFNLWHDDQHLIIDGIASQQKTDSLLIDLNGIDVAYILDLVDFHAVDFGGQASGKAYITQLFGDFDAWADLEIEQFTFMEGHMGTLLAHAEWSKEDKQVDLDAFADNGPDSQTFIEGFIAPSRDDIDLLIRARGSNAEFVNTFTSSFLDDVAGQVYGDVRLIGPLSSVNLTGELAVDGRLTVSALNTTYDLRGDSIFFVPNDIRLLRHRIYDRNGHVGYVSGALHHRNFTNFTFDLNVDAQNMLVYDFPTFDGSIVCGTVYADGSADLRGRPGEIVINCNVTPRRGSTFGYNAANPDAISKQQFITWRQKTINDSIGVLDDVLMPAMTDNDKDNDVPTDIYINFAINATPDATLRVLMDQNTGDYITLNGLGALRASFYNKGPFQMFGTYNVERGTYGITIQNIIKKNFNFQDEGTIVFGGDPYDAALNLQAVYTVNGVSLSDLQLGNSFTNNTIRVNCLMNIQGSPGAPRVDFDLEMPTVNSEEQQMIRSIIASEQELKQQVVYLLGIGRFYTQEANNAGTQEYGQTELAMQSLLSGTVSTQINELLSQVIKTDEWNFGANISTGNEGWHNAEYEGMVSGRMLNNRLLINGQFGYRDNATQTTPSFIGDFDIRYLLYPNGNLALKVYNQTNDRYFTRSSLNTQGIGLIMKKDFGSIGDLFHSRRKKNR